ncbi:hypothetical protein BT69DRAFT_1282958 [Atractiella rhizophila]|nr:hypothetical protein BT69DRAFT_1282958 [Atractiella rhizophila]
MKGNEFPPKGKGYNSGAYIYSGWQKADATFIVRGEQESRGGRCAINVSAQYDATVTIVYRSPQQRLDISVTSTFGVARVYLPPDFAGVLDFRLKYPHKQNAIKPSAKMKDRVTIYQPDSNCSIAHILPSGPAKPTSPLPVASSSRCTSSCSSMSDLKLPVEILRKMDEPILSPKLSRYGEVVLVSGQDTLKMEGTEIEVLDAEELNQDI